MSVKHYEVTQRGPISAAVQDGDTLYISGMSADSKGLSCADEFKEAFDRLETVIKASGFELHHILKVTLYYTQDLDLEAMNRMYAILFEDPYPARTLVGVSHCPNQKRLVIDVIAKKHEKGLHKHRFVCEGC